MKVPADRLNYNNYLAKTETGRPLIKALLRTGTLYQWLYPFGINYINFI